MPGYRYGDDGSSFFIITNAWGDGTQFAVYAAYAASSGVKAYANYPLDDSSLYKKATRKFYIGNGGDPTTSTGNNESHKNQ